MSFRLIFLILISTDRKFCFVFDSFTKLELHIWRRRYSRKTDRRHFQKKTKRCDNLKAGYNNSIQELASCLVSYPFLCNFDLDLWPWQRKGHRHLGNWMHLNGLYLGTKYEVCGSNRFWEMNPCLPNFLFDLEIWPLTLSQDQLSKFKWIGQMV